MQFATLTNQSFPCRLATLLQSHALVLLGAMLFFSAFSVQAQTPTPTPIPPQTRLDHFLCYHVQPTKFAGPNGISIIDQFNIHPLPVTVNGRDSLCNPVSKNGEAIPNKETHLLGYLLRVPPGEPLNIRVSIRNQFDEYRPQYLTVLRPVKLLVPTGKAEQEDPNKPPEVPPIPQKLDHYFCYTVKADQPFKPRQVTIQDQFDRNNGKRKVEVIDLALLCNPAEKRIKDKPTGHMFDNQDHLACYTLKPEEFRANMVLIHNQFEKRQLLNAVRPSLLCLPSSKQREEK